MVLPFSVMASRGHAAHNEIAMPDRIRGLVQDFSGSEFNPLQAGENALVLFARQRGEELIIQGFVMERQRRHEVLLLITAAGRADTKES